MKKIIIAATLLLPTINPLSPSNLAEASENTVAQKDLKLPDLSNAQFIEQFNISRFNYYGISFKDNKNNIVKKWGLPNNSLKVVKTYGPSENLFYGKKNNVILNTRKRYHNVNPFLMSISIKEKNSGQRFSKLYPLYKDKVSKIKKGNKIFLTNELSSITFEKKHKTYYATELTFYSVNTILE